jgi:hypothetical protein
MHDKLRMLVLGDLTANINRLTLALVHRRGTGISLSTDSPAAVMRHHVLILSGHTANLSTARCWPIPQTQSY